MHLSKSPSINDVSSKGEGGGQNVGIYLVQKDDKGGGRGVIKSEKLDDAVYGWPLHSFSSNEELCTRKIERNWASRFLFAC